MLCFSAFLNHYSFKNSVYFLNKVQQRGHSESKFAQNFQFLTPFSLFHSCSFYIYPSSTYVRFSELSPSQKKFCDGYDAYFE